MVVLGEPMEHVQSAAFTFLLPCGAARLPQGCCGAAEVILDWLFRGAGPRDSRALSDALDGLGVQRHSSVSAYHLNIAGTLEASNLLAALDIYADVILHPRLDPDQFRLSRELALQELAALEDEPQQKVMMLLYEHFYPDPLGRPTLGKVAEVQGLDAQRAAGVIRDRFDLGRAIFAVAGKYDFDAVCRRMETLFAAAPAKTTPAITPQANAAGSHHEHHDGAQVHIGLMTPAPPIAGNDYYNIMAAVSILGGGMSSRLFTEVREKRGLCYAVGARYNTLCDRAGIGCYAGTTPDKAQQTLDLIVHEFTRLREEVSEDEMHRARIGLKSTLVMQSESTSARAGGIAGDYFLLGRVRPLAEIRQRLEETTRDSVLGFLNRNPFSKFTVVSVGPQQLDLAGI